MPAKVLDIGESENVIVVSDVHLRSPEDSLSHLFYEFIDKVGRDFSCDTLILLGDIFDFFNARQRFYFELWRELFDRIKELRGRGVRVILAEGNHDYGFEHNPCHEIRSCFDECGDVILLARVAAFGEIVLLHGDDVVCPPSYKIFRSLVKSSVFQSVLAPIPGWLTSGFFSRYAKFSRSKDHYRPLDPLFLTECSEQLVERLCESFDLRPKVCILGHIHVNLDDQLGEVRFMSGPAWFTSPSALFLKADGSVDRIWLQPSRPEAERFLFAKNNQPRSQTPLS